MSVFGRNFNIKKKYQSILRLNQQLKPIKEDCPLNNSELGVFSENDHLNSQCLCILCTCGRHTCPKQTLKDPYLKSTYITSYETNFQRAQNSTPLKVTYQKPFIPGPSSPIKSLSQQTYQKPRQINRFSITKERAYPPPKLNFMGKSTYSSNFPDWKSPGNYHVKEIKVNHTNPELEVALSTSYADTFTLFDKSQYLRAKEDFNDVSQLRINSAFKLGSPLVVKQSHTTKQFPNLQGRQSVQRVQRPEDPILKMHIGPRHFKSTNQQSYSMAKQPINGRAYRKMLQQSNIYQTDQQQ